MNYITTTYFDVDALSIKCGISSYENMEYDLFIQCGDEYIPLPDKILNTIAEKYRDIMSEYITEAMTEYWDSQR